MSLNMNITKPPSPLPIPQLKVISPGLSLLPPLSRKGTGPGLIIVTADSETNNVIREGVPSPLRKWAEEGYTVVEIQQSAIKHVEFQDYKELLKLAVKTLLERNKCDPKGGIGMVVYDPWQWGSIEINLRYAPDIVVVALYSYPKDSGLAPVGDNSIPLICHFPERTKTIRTSQRMEYEYPKVKSHRFAEPFHEDFDYSAEAVSHTRNLTFLKRHMNGPYFDLEAIWDEHTYFEFENRSVEHTMSTMVDEPYVNHIPTITGGIGRDNLTNFYAHHFIFKNAADTELELVSRTIGVDRVVDEFIYKFTHDAEVGWLIPGVPPTGKYLEIPFTAIVNIRGDRLYHEHIAWDQGTVLRQLDLLPDFLPYTHPLPDGRKAGQGLRFEYRVPVAGRETALKMRDKNSVVSNEMFQFGVREVKDVGS